MRSQRHGSTPGNTAGIPTRSASFGVAHFGFCPEGAPTDQPRATPWVRGCPPKRRSPERAKQHFDCVALSGLEFRSISAPSQGVALGWYVVAPSGRANSATPKSASEGNQNPRLRFLMLRYFGTQNCGFPGKNRTPTTPGGLSQARIIPSGARKTLVFQGFRALKIAQHQNLHFGLV